MLNHQIVQSYSHLELLAKHVVEGFITGLHKSPFHGFSVEFAEHRLYNTGESTKHIDWKLYGRTEKLFIKRYEEETNLRCQIVIDNSSSMYFPIGESSKEKPYNKISYAAYCAAAFVYLLKNQRDAFGLTLYTNQVDLHTPAKSSPIHQKMVFTELDKLFLQHDAKVTHSTETSAALHQIAEQIHKRSLVVIFTDLFNIDSKKSEDFFNALQHLKHNKHEVILFHVFDKKFEDQFEFENRPYEFVDMETNEILKLNPTEVQEMYRKKVTDLFAQFKLKCQLFAIDFVNCDIHEPIHHTLNAYLIKRSKLL
jgi:uncharacterized protein (DUF58 family)